MAELRDLLEVYGALDEAAASDPAAAATLNSFLPGAGTNTGWYREIEQYFFPDDVRSPNFARACQAIATDAATNAWSAPQKSRLHYGLCVAARVKDAAPASTLSAFSDAEFDQALTNGLTAVAPAATAETIGQSEDVGPNFRTWVGQILTGRDQYYALRISQAQSNIVDPAVLDIPLCRAAVRVVDGVRSVVVDTATSSALVSLTNLKKVVNPFNWADNYEDFFVSMDTFAEPPFRQDLWKRVRETVGFRNIPATQIVTGLKYHATEELDKNVARIDYDLDDPAPARGCDGKVRVDKGYINMWGRTGDPDDLGVKVRTRKIVNIANLSPIAQKRLVCLTGYGTASNEFLFNPAMNPRPEARPFLHYTQGDPSPSEQAQAASATPQEPDTHVVATAVGMWADALQGFTNDYFDLSEKWLGGRLTLSDITDYTQQTTGRLVSGPLQFLEKISQPRYPGGTGSGGQGGAS
ncbi:hypothetical protein AB0K11_03985 [Mycobacterium sp. NPDC050551]|uniref:hypothetical protein n=1 Tax=Mycobacterium sp. NPDC050551 TaxID=3155407 RepID=UPI0034320E5F